MKSRLVAAILALLLMLLASSSAQAIFHRDNRILDIVTALPLSDTSAQLRLAFSDGIATTRANGHLVTQNISMKAVHGNAVVAN